MRGGGNGEWGWWVMISGWGNDEWGWWVMMSGWVV